MFGLFKKRKQEESVVDQETYTPTPLAQAIIDATADYDRWDWFENRAKKEYLGSARVFVVLSAEDYVYVDKRTGVDFNQYDLRLRHAPAGMAFDREDQEAIAMALLSMRKRYERDQEAKHASQCREQLEAAYMVGNRG